MLLLRYFVEQSSMTYNAPTCRLVLSDWICCHSCWAACQWFVCCWLHLSWRNHPGAITCLKRDPTVFFSLFHSEQRKSGGWGWMRHEGLICMRAAKFKSHTRKSSTAMQMRGKSNSNGLKVREGSKRWQHRCVFAYEKTGTVSSFRHTVVCPRPRAEGLSSFTTTVTAVCWGKDKPWHQNSGSSSEDNTSLCGRRAKAWPGWTEASLSGPAGHSSCLNLCLYPCHTHTISIQHESWHSIRTKGQHIYVKSLYPCVSLPLCVCVCASLSVPTSSPGTQRWRRSGRRAPEKET